MKSLHCLVVQRSLWTVPTVVTAYKAILKTNPLLICTDLFYSVTSLTAASPSWPSDELLPTLCPCLGWSPLVHKGDDTCRVPARLPHVDCCLVDVFHTETLLVSKLFINKLPTNTKLWNNWVCVLNPNFYHEKYSVKYWAAYAPILTWCSLSC